MIQDAGKHLPTPRQYWYARSRGNRRRGIGRSPAQSPPELTSCICWVGSCAHRLPGRALWGLLVLPRQVPGAVGPRGGPRQVTKQSDDGKPPAAARLRLEYVLGSGPPNVDSPPVRRTYGSPRAAGGTRQLAGTLTTVFPTASSRFSTQHHHQAPHIPSPRPKYYPTI